MQIKERRKKKEKRKKSRRLTLFDNEIKFYKHEEKA